MKKFLVLFVLSLSSFSFAEDLRGAVTDAAETIFGKMGAILIECPKSVRAEKETAYLCAAYTRNPASFISWWDLYSETSEISETYNLRNSGAWRYENNRYKRVFFVGDKVYSIYLVSIEGGTAVYIREFLDVNRYLEAQPTQSPNETLATGVKFVSQNYAFISIREFTESFPATFTRKTGGLTLTFNGSTVEFFTNSNAYLDINHTAQVMVGPAMITNGVYVVPARVLQNFGCVLAPAPGDPFSLLVTCPAPNADGPEGLSGFILKRY
jgi:hypothetical protein